MWLVRFGCFFVCGYVAGFDLVALVVSSVSLVVGCCPDFLVC